MACNCGSKNRSTNTATASAGTFRVMVNNSKVYESDSETAATTVAARFANATILKPGETA